MGADITIKINKSIDIASLLKEAADVPIDCSINDSKTAVDFHFAYWGVIHIAKCRSFIIDFVKKNKLKMGKWSY